MDPTVWGPNLWVFIHSIALNFPNNPSFEEIKNYESFFENLKYIIPCDKCRLHYRQRLNDNPVSKYLTDSNALFIYTIDLHNEVNKSLGKRIYTYEEVAKIYRNKYNSPYKLNKIFSIKHILILLFIMIIIGLILYGRTKYKFRLIKA